MEISEERFKSEAITFFNLSPEHSTKSKPIFKREILNFMTVHTNTQKNLTREFLRGEWGSGKHSEMRNATNVDIGVPMKRVFKKNRLIHMMKQDHLR